MKEGAYMMIFDDNSKIIFVKIPEAILMSTHNVGFYEIFIKTYVVGAH